MTILDFTAGDYGAACTEYLALTGMNVIRIDKPADKEITKEEKYYFITGNLNKKCITLDAETPAGKALMWELIGNADALVENRQPGYMKEIGFDYESVKTRNPGLVYTSIQPFASGSPWAGRRATSSTISAAGGATYLCGQMGGIPVPPGPDLPDFSTCGFAATGIVAALYQREFTGEGQFIEVSMQDAVIAHARSAFEAYHNNKRNIRVGNAFPTVPDMIPMDLFRTKGDNEDEDWAVIGCLGEPMFAQLCKAIGKPELLDDPRFKDMASRAKHKDELTAILSGYAIKFDKFELMSYLLQKNRVICSAVHSIKDMIESEDLRETGLIQKVSDPELGDIWLPAFPAIYSDIEIKAKNPGAPGACNEEIFKELLSLSARERANICYPEGCEAEPHVKKALEGVTVVAAELAESGPVTTQILGFLGADVIHVERPDSKEDRYVGSIIRNCNKKTITLDTKTETGKEIMWKLLEKADVFFENFAPGAWDRMGFSYEDVKKRNPGILYVTLKGFAKASRWGDCIAFDPVAACSGGSAYTCGYEDHDPMLCGINVADTGVAIHAAMAISIAILQRKLTGKGQFIETPMQNAVVVNCSKFFAEYYLTGGKVRRAGNTYRGYKPTAPHNIYPTQGSDVTGNYIAIACSPDEASPDFKNLCAAINKQDLLDDPRFSTPALRYENRLALDFEITKWTRRHSKAEAMRILLMDYDVPSFAVNSMMDICEDPFLGNTILRRMPDPEVTEVHMPVIPINMEKNVIETVTCGQHGTANDEIYGGFLGLSEAEIAELRENRVI